MIRFGLFSLISCLLLVAQCQGSEEELNGFFCPDSAGVSLMTTTVSGCKVHYTCENGTVLKIFQCSESQVLAGSTQICQENPQCPGFDSLEELKKLQKTTEASSDENCGITTRILLFVKCLLEVSNVDEFTQTCLDKTLFQEKQLLEIEIPPKVLESYSKLFNVSQSTEESYYTRFWNAFFGRLWSNFYTYLIPNCKVACDGFPKPNRHLQHIPPSEFQKIGFGPNGEISEDAHEEQYASMSDAQRVRRSSPGETFGVLRMLISTGRQIRLSRPTVQPPTEKPVVTTSKPVEIDNSTLMSDVIVPIIHNIVNDEQALKNLTSFVRGVFEAAVPLATEILKASNESFDHRTVLKIPRGIVNDTIRDIKVNAYPHLQALMSAKAPFVLELLAHNTKLLLGSWDEMEARLEPNVKVLRNQLYRLFSKYFSVFKSSTKDIFHTYSLIEIQQDIESVYNLLPEVSRELFLQNWSVFQDVSGVTTESVSKMLHDIPGIFEVMDAIPFEHFMYFMLLFI